MAHIYAGELSRIDPEVLAAVKALSDDYWVFAEVTIERNVDWTILRPAPVSTLIAMELKRSSLPVRGTVDGTWERLSRSNEWEEIPPSGEDMNYYWQAVNAANALSHWLWLNQRLYREADDVRPQDEFRVWPDLVILSPPGVTHRLPLSPPSRYGRWFYGLQEWVWHVEGWSPRVGVALTAEDVENLARALRLKSIWESNAAASPTSVPATEAVSDELQGFMAWLRGLEDKVERLTNRVMTLESRIDNGTTERAESLPASPPRAPAPAAPRPPGSATQASASADRAWTEEEQQALQTAVSRVRQSGKSRALPTILAEMSLVLGYNLKDRAYNGYGTARAMFDRARGDGLLEYGPFRGPNPTIFLAGETVSEE